MQKKIRIPVVLCILLWVAGCVQTPLPTAPPVSPGKSVVDVPRTTAEFDSAQGVIGPGSLYGLYRPHVWNGDLVVYAHGLVSPLDPNVQLPDVDAATRALRDALLADGFAVAMSSYPENGYCVKEAIIATGQLRGRAVFDYYYPGVLPGTVTSVPVGTDIDAAIGNAIGAMLTNPAPPIRARGRRSARSALQ